MKTDDPLSSDDGAQREETAGMWLARRDRGLTPGEQREFDGWLKSDARHGPLLEELEFAYRT